MNTEQEQSPEAECFKDLADSALALEQRLLARTERDKGLPQLLCDLVSLLRGWHSDGTSWSEWDSDVLRRLLEFQAKCEPDNTSSPLQP